jgi:hypothetical protein
MPPGTTVFVHRSKILYDNPMAKAHKFDLENPAPILDDEDKETLAAIDEGIRDAEAVRVVPAEKARELLPGAPSFRVLLRKGGSDAAGANRFRSLITL